MDPSAQGPGRGTAGGCGSSSTACGRNTAATPAPGTTAVSRTAPERDGGTGRSPAASAIRRRRPAFLRQSPTYRLRPGGIPADPDDARSPCSRERSRGVAPRARGGDRGPGDSGRAASRGIAPGPCGTGGPRPPPRAETRFPRDDGPFARDGLLWDLEIGERSRSTLRRRQVVRIGWRLRGEEAAADANLESGITRAFGDDQPLGIRRGCTRTVMHEEDERRRQREVTAGPDPLPTETASRLDLEHGGAKRCPVSV